MSRHNSNLNLNINESMDMEYKQFKYGPLLFMSILPALGVMLAFGGRPTLLALSFASIATYIFDIMGSIEGSFLAIIVGLLFVWGTLIWAGRFILLESMINVSMIAVMGMILMIIFMIVCGQFHGMIEEFGIELQLIESSLFSIIPFISSVLLTWFISVELPLVDTSICFVFIYFVFTINLTSPRKSLLYRVPVKNNMESSGKSSDVYIINTKVATVLYSLPIIYAPMLSIASHHRYMFVSWNHLSPILTSFLMSLLLMSVVVEHHMEYFMQYDVNSIKLTIEIIQLIGGASLITCLQTHSFFDDIKALAVSKSLVSTSIVLCAYSVAITIALHRYRHHIDNRSNSKQSKAFVFMISVIVYIFSMISAILFAVILNLPRQIFPVTAIGGLALAVYYFKYWLTASPREYIWSFFLVFTAGWSAAVTFQFFLDQTLSPLVVTFTWFVDVSIQNLCFIASSLVALAILLPALGHWIKIQEGKNKTYLPNSSRSLNMNAPFSKIPPPVFEVIYQIIAMSISAIELLVRELDWARGLSIDVERVYPSYLMFVTAALLVFTAYHCWALNFMRISAVWLISLSQSIKFLHLIGLPSIAAGAVGAMVFALVSPFLNLYEPTNPNGFSPFSPRGNRTIAVSTNDSSDDNGIEKNVEGVRAVSAVASIWQIFQAALAICWFHEHLAYQTFVYLLSRIPTDVEIFSGCVAIFCAFLALYSLYFLPNLPVIRSMSAMICAMCTLIATGSAGFFTVSIDEASPTYFVLTPTYTIADLADDSRNSGICFIISIFLILAATLNIFPVKSMMYRMLFLVSFSYTSSQALLGWSYPLSISVDSSNHNIFHFPFVHTFVLVVMTTSTGLHSTLPNDSDLGESIFLVVLAWVVGGMVWCILLDLHEELDGVLWSAIIVTCSVAVATRIAQVLRHVNGIRPKQPTSTATTVCGLAAVLAILASVALSVLGHHHVELDFLVPISSTILITTRKGLFIPECHPMELSILVCIFWWISRVVYSMFIEGYGQAIDLDGFQDNFGFFQNANISIWTSVLPSWLLVSNIMLAFLPLPAILLSFWNRKDESEEIVFILAIISLVSLVGAQANCIRFIGGFGTVYASWRCYEIGARSNMNRGN